MTENTLTLASSLGDAQAAAVLEGRHAEMAGGLAVRVVALQGGADAQATSTARADLVAWVLDRLLPALGRESDALYAAAGRVPSLRGLVETQVAEQRALEELVGELQHAASADAARATARAFQVLLEGHLRRQDEVLVPALAAAPDVALEALVAGLPDPPALEDGCGSGHSCSCGEQDGPGYPELDARGIPHAIRHATIFGALDGVGAGGGMVLVAPHDPLPLLAQLEQRAPGAFEVRYLERGPEAWRIQLVRRG